MEVDSKWKKYAEEENARLRAEFEAKNPSVAAKRLYDEGNYEEAIEKYDLAISEEEDDEKKASYLFSKASIQFRKLKQYSTARSTAYQAAKLKPDWGRPYMLIGDMYATSARNCGDDWNQRMAILAAIDKYAYARSIDAEVADEANKKIGRYQASKPELSEGHMRGVKEGETQTVSCWISEKVKVSFK
jgi:tetratricopeptide (TPR) repeat protein